MLLFLRKMAVSAQGIEMKTCFKCGETKPTTEFYRHKMMADGFLGKCKTCTKRDAREHRAENIERYREYDRVRGRTEDRKKRAAEYAKTPTGKAISNKAKAEWSARNKEKKAATVAVNNAVRDRRLFKQPCESCGEKKTQAHHDDYTKPLDVRWLCTKCHAIHHRKLRGH
jgi:ribosomal protein S27AE